MPTLILEFNDRYFKDLAEQIIKDGINIDYLVTSNQSQFKNKLFNKTQIINEENFHYATNILELNKGNEHALSADFLDKFVKTENLFLSITDRLTFYHKPVNYRKQLFCELLLYWKCFLLEKKIDKIIFPRVPHLGYGNIVYDLAKSLHINVVIIRETLIENQILITKSFEAYEKVPITFLKNKQDKELRSLLSEDLKAIFSTQSKLMSVNVNDNKQTLKKNSSSIINLIFNLENIQSILRLIHNPFSQHYASYAFLEEKTFWWQFYIMLFRYYFHNRFLLKYYRKKSKAFNPKNNKKRYVYFALHYQPERTSMPEGGVFENQLLMIDILAKALPKNMVLVVKEHPNQFHRSDLRLKNFRAKYYYNKISQYKNVIMANIDTNPKDLITNSLATVTLTGSTGWEALLNSVPVITFTTSAWYYPCNSCYLAKSTEDIIDVLVKIRQTNKNIVRTDLLKYLIYYQKKFVQGSYDITLTNDFDIETYHLSLKNISTAIKNKINE